MCDAPAPVTRRYALSFTTGALIASEAALLAPVYVKERDWETVRDRAVEGKLLQARTHRTGVRLVRETVKRLSALTDEEVELLVEATASERGHLMWVAACRRYVPQGLRGRHQENRRIRPTRPPAPPSLVTGGDPPIAGQASGSVAS